MRNATLDRLKIVLAFFVVGIHAGLLSDVSPTASYLLAQGLFRIAVPLFLIINGFYLCDHLERQGKPFWLWFQRVAILYCVWTIIYSPLIAIDARDSGSLGWFKVVKHLVLGYFHLWYLPAMLAAGVAMWILHRLSSMRVLGIALLLFASGLALQYSANYGLVLNPDTPHWLYRNGLFIGFPFFAIGYLLRRHQVSLSSRWSVTTIRLLVASAFALVFAEAMANYRAGGEEFDILLSLIIACPLLFAVADENEHPDDTRMLARMSTAVYLVHPLLLAAFAQLGVESQGTLMFLLAASSAVVAGSMLALISSRLRPIALV